MLGTVAGRVQSLDPQLPQLQSGKQAALVLIEPLSLSASTDVAVLCEAHSGTFTVYGEETKVVALRVGSLR